MTRVAPNTEDADTAGFWEAARRGELAVRVCDECGRALHLPRAYCHRCGSWAGSWKAVSGLAQLHSWTTVVHQVHPAFRPPYTVVLVELADHPGVRFLGWLAGEPALQAGQPMQVWFETLADGTVLPQWRPVLAEIPHDDYAEDGAGPFGETAAWEGRNK